MRSHTVTNNRNQTVSNCQGCDLLGDWVRTLRLEVTDLDMIQRPYGCCAFAKVNSCWFAGWSGYVLETVTMS
jgi:hypothetical protein